MPKVEMYVKGFCPYCVRAKQLLAAKGVAVAEYAIDMDSAKRQEMIQRAKGRMTVPQIFIDGQHVGGCDDLHALERAGKLNALLSDQ